MQDPTGRLATANEYSSAVVLGATVVVVGGGAAVVGAGGRLDAVAAGAAAVGAGSPLDAVAAGAEPVVVGAAGEGKAADEPAIAVVDDARVVGSALASEVDVVVATSVSTPATSLGSPPVAEQAPRISAPNATPQVVRYLLTCAPIVNAHPWA